jgi:hypothetical protein
MSPSDLGGRSDHHATRAPLGLVRARPAAWFNSVRPIRARLGGARSTPDIALLGTSSRLGLPAELLCKRQQQAPLFATFVQQENHIARAVWAGVAPVHRLVVRYLLERASRRMREKERDG